MENKHLLRKYKAPIHAISLSLSEEDKEEYDNYTDYHKDKIKKQRKKFFRPLIAWLFIFSMIS